MILTKPLTFRTGLVYPLHLFQSEDIQSRIERRVLFVVSEQKGHAVDLDKVIAVVFGLHALPDGRILIDIKAAHNHIPNDMLACLKYTPNSLATIQDRVVIDFRLVSITGKFE